MKTGRKAKVSVTLDRDLLAAIDRRATRGATRSQVIEQWLRLSVLAQAHRDLEAATAAYYEGRTADQRTEDEALAAFSTRGLGQLDLDRRPPPRRHRGR
jgi:metal-responsive CopG/Arc/MetJ family transcriptional regulator